VCGEKVKKSRKSAKKVNKTGALSAKTKDDEFLVQTKRWLIPQELSISSRWTVIKTNCTCKTFPWGSV
jgi:hypothetical protein